MEMEREMVNSLVMEREMVWEKEMVSSLVMEMGN